MNISHFFTARKMLASTMIMLVLLGGSNSQAQAQAMTPTSALVTLHTFDNTYGANPLGGLVQASDGNFYGTAYSGGKPAPNAGYAGVVFRINPTTHQYTTLHKFSGPDGALPKAGLILATDSNLYGTTQLGGTSHYGTIYKITLDGVFTSIYSFTGHEGKQPYGGVVQGTDGNFYGTTLYGGANNYGIIFKLTPAGTLTTLYSFDRSTTGAYPRAALVQDTDGSFYGTTSQGGANDKGVVFRLRPNGSYAVLHTFDGTYGAVPFAALVKGADGAFYGTAPQGGNDGRGVIFKITSTGQFTTLHKFGPDLHGKGPYAGLTLGVDGSFYGATYGGGFSDTSGHGTLFKMTPEGQVTTLYKFGVAAHGYSPQSNPVFGTDGALYGTTSEGGYVTNNSGYGTIYKLTLPQ